MDFITIIETQEACNKQVTRNQDGTLTKTPAGVVSAAKGHTVYVPNATALQAMIDKVSRTTNQTISLGYVPGTEDGVPFTIATKAGLLGWIQSGQYQQWEHGIVDANGEKYTSRSKDHFTQSSWLVFDKDTVDGMPADLNYPDPTSWWAAMCDLVPGLAEAAYLYVPSTSSRILNPDGSPAFADGGWHFYVQAHDANDINRFGTELLVHSLAGKYGFMRELYDSSTREVIGHRPWSIFDPTTFTQERLIFEGQPVVHGGLLVADTQMAVKAGGKLNTATLRVDDADAKMIEAKTGYKIERQRNGLGMTCNLMNDTDLKPETVITTAAGEMTVQQFWDSDYPKLRCQAVFRPDSGSMAAFLSRHANGEPFLYDIGTHTKFCLDKMDAFYNSVNQLQQQQHQSVGAAAVQGAVVGQDQPLIPEANPYQVLVAQADQLGPDDRAHAVELYLLACELGPLEASDLVKHHMRQWNKSDIERAARDIRNRRREEAKIAIRRQQLQVGNYALLNTPPDTPMDSVPNFLSRFIFIANECVWFDRLTGQKLKADAFNHYFRHLMEDFFPERVAADIPLPRPTDVFSDSPMSVKVDGVTYWPGVETEIVQIEDRVALNSWKKSKFQLAVEKMDYTVTPDQIKPYLDLLEYLIPNEEERNYVFDWMAFNMQNPHIKVNHALVIGGEERIGKDTLLLPFARFIGEDNTSTILASRLDEPFADFLVGIYLLIIEEIHKDSNRDAKATENQLKPYNADPPYHLKLPQKGRADAFQPNLLQMVMFSNYRDALHLSSEGGRYYCVWSPAIRRSESYYKELYSWMEEGVYLVARWLFQRDVSQFQPKAPAPSTEWREEMSDGGKTDIEREILDVMEELNQAGVCYVTAQTVKEKLDKLNPGSKFIKVSAIGRYMGNLKLAKIRAPDRNRINVPKIFTHYDGLPITPDSFKERTRTSIYFTDINMKGLHDVEDIEAVKSALCPEHMRTHYENFKRN